MLGTKFSKNKKAQHGSVMLEVIAVLALMGVMGAMLFRQIYQRNQELHNIQMASEIRTVKEAFSAYIQAYRAVLLNECTLNADDPTVNLGTCTPTSADLGKAIKEYLPAGWFLGGGPDGGPQDYYTFSLWTYQQADSSAKQVIFGIIAPKETTLPTTGWNFKRAARVALLVGADGGVYDNTITGSIAGSLGAWTLTVAPQMALQSPTYVAMTGLDVFTPEYELPEGQVNLPKNWSLATENLGAWNAFYAGMDSSSPCYSIGHEIYNPTVGNDTFNNCNPLFKVDWGTKKVFVNNDLEIGSGTTTNLTLTQEGVIKQKEGLTIDADGRIISKDKLATAIGDLKEEDPYVIDPKYTSVMGDIRLVSRGGVRLSDILPKYILKGTQDLSCTISSGGTNCTSSSGAAVISCPTGYNKAYLITPIQFATQDKGNDSPVSVTTEGTVVTDVEATGNPVTINLTKVNVTATGDSFIKSITPNNLTVSVDADRKIKFTYSSPLKSEQTMTARVDSYCVYNDTGVSADMTQAECTAAGFTWNSDSANGKIPHCRYVYSVANINAMTDATKKVATCKAAGFTWNGTNCTNP